MWQIRLKLRVPAFGWQHVWWFKGQAPLGTIWLQLAVTVPAIVGFDFEVATQ